MEKSKEQIQCPRCGADIDVNAILYHQLEEQLEERFNARLADEQQQIKDQKKSLDEEKKKLEQALEENQAAVDRQVREQVRQMKENMAAEARKEAGEEIAETLAELRKELEEKSGRLKELNRTKAELEKTRREKEELAEEIEARAEARISETLRVEREKIQKTEAQKNELKLKESQDLVESLKKQLSEAQRKAEQGSMQSQGEVQELAIEQWLREQFPMDSIEEVKKGVQGADCLQVVNTRSHEACGSIYYESKRTKAFSPSWIEKFKADIRDKGADIGVLVTSAMPAGMERMGLVDGVWVCSFEEFKGLAAVLRETVIRVHGVGLTQVNRGGKMEMLYTFLTGNEFRQQVEAIVEGFSQMQSDLESEKRAMTAQWKKREKQLEKVILNTTYMYSSIKGIAGSAVQSVQLLELEEPAHGESGTRPGG